MNSNEAFDSIWTALIDVEEYIQYGIPKQLHTAVSFSGDDMVPVHNAFQTARRLDPFLSTDILSASYASLEVAQSGLNRFLNALRAGVAIPKTDVGHRQEAIRTANNVLNQVLHEFRSSLKNVSALHNATILSSRQRSETKYDAFISHASEDKAVLVRPLVKQLEKNGCKIWYDEFELTVGDSLRCSIDKGLVDSRFGIVVLSSSFFSKNWPEYELNGLVAKEIDGVKVILPIWHNVSKHDVLNYSPTLADKYALSTARVDIEELASQLVTVLKSA
jgi:hypothetical protein